MQRKCEKILDSGFTLIELSVFLVVIGLILGGIFVSRGLINSSTISAQISQINKFNSAVQVFRSKYKGLPGDLPDPYATHYGFQSRGINPGEGDGNGVIEGNCADIADANNGMQQGCGELAVFWQDLSSAGLIDLGVKTGTGYPLISSNTYPNTTLLSTPHVSGWIPAAKLGNDQYIYVTSFAHTNYFVIQRVFQLGWNAESTGVPGAGANAMTVQQAYTIDSKIDDGLPQSGNVIACASDYDVNPNYQAWAAGSGQEGAGTAASACTPTTARTPYQAYNCYDNNNMGGTELYSTAKNANTPNCALSFKFR